MDTSRGKYDKASLSVAGSYWAEYLQVICCFLSDNKLHTVHLSVIVIASLKVINAIPKNFFKTSFLLQAKPACVFLIQSVQPRINIYL